MTQMTTSAALFYPCERHQPVPPEWLERALDLFGRNALHPVLFTAAGGDFELDDGYVFSNDGDLVLWDDPFPARGDELVRALQVGDIYDVSLDSPRHDAKTRSDYRAETSAGSVDGELFLGLDRELADNPGAVLKDAWRMAEGLFSVRYGFAYQMPLADEPDCYATGSRSVKPSEFREWIRRRHAKPPLPKTPDELWRDEIGGAKRHLTGLFRGAYPANVLSEAHVQGAELLTKPIGRLTELGDKLWLWELGPDEIRAAEERLASKNLLVQQADPVG